MRRDVLDWLKEPSSTNDNDEDTDDDDIKHDAQYRKHF